MPPKLYLLLSLLVAGISHAGTTGSAISYQGELKRLGTPANGVFDLRFELFNLASSGVPLGTALLLENITVVDGVFTVELDFGSAPFDGDQLWMEIGVREGTSTGGYTELLPRQKLTAARALHAIDDADPDEINEIQDLSLNMNTMGVTGDAMTVDFSAYLDDTNEQTFVEVLTQGADAGGQSVSNVQNLTANGMTTASALTVSGLDCTVNASGGVLTGDVTGTVTCSDEDEDSANSLDGAYDQDGPGAGRKITADAGAVVIEGNGGLVLGTGSLNQFAGGPVTVGSLGIGMSPNSVHVSGRYAYVVDPDSDDFRVIDVSDPGAPSLLGSLVIGGAHQSVHVSGRYAYLVDALQSAPMALKVIDVSDPSSPILVGTHDFGILSSPGSVYVSGSYAYIIDPLFKVVDVSNPTMPATIGVTGSGGGSPRSLVVAGRYAYVAREFLPPNEEGGLTVIDISDPSSPDSVGNLNLQFAAHYGVYVSGRHAYLVDRNLRDLKVIDVSDPSLPVVAGSLAIGTSPQSVYVSGRYAYVVDSGSDDLKVIDVSDPAAPSLAGSLAIGGDPTSVFVSGRYAYVVDEDSNDLKVIDISGAEVTSLIAHSLEAGNLQVRNDIVAQGELQVTSGVAIGSGGLFSDGDVGIAGDLTIEGDAFIDGGLTVGGSCAGCASDRDLKCNIEPLDDALERIHQLRGVSFDWRPDAREARYYSGPQIGVLGQEVEAVFPEMVGTDSRGYQFVRYQELVPPLIEAVKALQAENEALEARLATLEAEHGGTTQFRQETRL